MPYSNSFIIVLIEVIHNNIWLGVVIAIVVYAHTIEQRHICLFYEGGWVEGPIAWGDLGEDSLVLL